MKIFIFMFVSLILCGCRQVEVSSECGGEFLDEGRKVMQAIADADFDRFAAVSGDPPTERGVFADSCRKIKAEFGTVTALTCLTSLKTPPAVRQIWLISFERKNRQGKTIRHKQLFQLVFGKIDSRARIIGMRFM